MEKRPLFKELKSYQEFMKYYWYREELIQICKELRIEHIGTKAELNHYIEEYFHGNIISHRNQNHKLKTSTEMLTLNTKLIECGFCFNQRFRDFFIEQTGKKNFKFNTTMVATAKKVRENHDENFTLKDMLDVYYGNLEYARYDHSSCQWNQFLKDFCADESNNVFSDKLKVASILWKEIRNSTRKKVYSSDLIQEYDEIIKKFKKNE
ncbi:MAG: SAP domain-containing protein [Anaeroplasmataceae bacterium]|nr:SAP domain-containing protein [Anaeroplasmataceae bacterium]